MSQDNILSISSLNPQSPENWKIVAKVQNRSCIKKGPTGMYFFVDLSDSTGEIRAIAYNLEADRLYQKFKVSRVYTIENGKIQRINEEYRELDNDFEIVFNKHSEITENKLKNNVPKRVTRPIAVETKEEDSSVGKDSESQHNEFLEDRGQNNVADDETSRIDKRLKEIEIEELVLAIEKLDLKYKKEKKDLETKLMNKMI